MKYLDLFSGIGGFSLPLTELGHECIGFSEIDKYATQIYLKHFPSHAPLGDITKLDPATLPGFDLIVGGFPCQSFSIAGKRGGFNDTRGTLFFDIARIARVKRPRLLLLENVKGLLSHDRGRTFDTIIRTLDELGYDVQWQVLNSKNFGVPQNRERVFIIGHLRGTARPQIFPLGENGEIPTERQGQISPTITSRYYKQGQSDPYVVSGDLQQINQPTHSNNRVYGSEGISPSLNTMQGGNRQPKIITHYGHKDKQAKEHAIFPTLKAQSHGHEPMVNGTKIRRLTPLECERLQGFPDGWTEGVSDSQRYKMLGNAVTVNVTRAIVKLLTPQNHE